MGSVKLALCEPVGNDMLQIRCKDAEDEDSITRQHQACSQDRHLATLARH